MIPDPNTGWAPSPVFIALAACVALVMTGGVWTFVAFSDLCCCLRRRRRRRRLEAADDPKYDAAADVTDERRPRPDGAGDDSVRYDDETDDKSDQKAETATKRNNDKGNHTQKSEKRGVFHSKKETKKAAASQKSQDVSIKDRISAFESSGSAQSEVPQSKDAAKPKRKKPSSKAFQEFERSGIIIGFGRAPKRHLKSTGEGDDHEEHQQDEENMLQGQGPTIRVDSNISEPSHHDNNSNTNSLNRLTDDEGIHTMDEEDEFSAVTRQSEILKSFRRAPPPKHRSRANRLPKRISTRKETQNFPGFDFPLEQEEESEASVGTTPSHSSDSVMTPSDRVTPENDTTTSGHHTGEDSPRGMTPDSTNKEINSGKTASVRESWHTGNKKATSPQPEDRDKYVILVVGKNSKEGSEREKHTETEQHHSVREVKEVTFNDFISLVQRPNSVDNTVRKEVSERHSASNPKTLAISQDAPPTASETAFQGDSAASSPTAVTSSQTSSARSRFEQESKQSNQNNNNVSETETNNTTPRSGSSLVLTRPRSFQPTSFTRTRDPLSPRSNLIKRNSDFPNRNRFSSVTGSAIQQPRTGAERSRSMSVGSTRFAEKWVSELEARSKKDQDDTQEKTDEDKSDDKEQKSFQETAI